ncbi:MAG: hypothetical protein KJO31_14380 [Gammaproteobacteria bacterium]|nr:hypothetical protein [Gammaproteobacteria bacterium]
MSMSIPGAVRAFFLIASSIVATPAIAETSPPEFVSMSSYVAAGGNYVAWLAPESNVGEDLDGDGMANDTVLMYRHIDTGVTTNTGIAVYPFRIETDGSVILFLQHEIYANEDLNGDGDRRDVVLAYYEIRRNEANYLPVVPHLNTGSLGQLRSYDVDGPMITFVQKEFRVGEDLNGDGDTNDYVIRYANLNDGSINNTPLVAPYAVTSHERIATTLSEGAMQSDVNLDGDTDDAVVVFYDPASGELRPVHSYRDHNLSNPNSFPAMDGWRLVYRVSESDGVDIDGDGSSNTQQLVFTADLYMDQTEFLGFTGSRQMYVEGDYLAYHTSEYDIGEDINGDGDTHWDWMIAVRNFRSGDVSYFEYGGEYVLGIRGMVMRTAEHRVDADMNDDGDQSDVFSTFIGIDQPEEYIAHLLEEPQTDDNDDQGIEPLFNEMIAAIGVFGLGDDDAAALNATLGNLFAVVSDPDLTDEERGTAAQPLLVQLVADIDGLLDQGLISENQADAALAPANMVLAFLSGGG